MLGIIRKMNRRANVFLFLAFCVLITSLSHSGTVSVKGTVSFADGEIPVVATVSLGTIDNENFAKVTNTDNIGNFAFQDVPPGFYTLTVFAVTGSRVGTFTKENFEITVGTELPIVINAVLSEAQ